MIFFSIKLILLAIFNISFFTITKATCTVSMWVSYGFIHFAFLMFFINPLFVRNSKSTKHIAIESVTLITMIYFICTLLAGIFFLFNPLLTLYQYSIESFITGIYLIILLVTIVVNNKIAANELEIATDKQFLNNIYIKAEFIKTKVADQKTLISLQEESKYSPVKSSESVRNVENEILNILDAVTLNIDTLSNEEISKKIEECRSLLSNRNLYLKKNM